MPFDDHHVSPDELGLLARRQYTGLALPTLFLSLGCIAAFVSLIALSVRETIPLWLAMPLQTYVLIIMFNPLHEAVHSNLTFARPAFRWIDKSVGFAAGAMMLLPFPMFRHTHLAHHARTNTEDVDPDLWTNVKGKARVTLACLTIQYAYLRMYLAFFLAARRGDRSWSGLAGTALVLVLALISLAIAPRFALALWIIPAWLAVSMIEFLHWSLHRPHASSEKYLNAKIIFATGWRHYLLRLLYQDLNCHLIHHLYPHVPFYRLEKTFPLMRKALKKNGAAIVSAKRSFREIWHS